MHYYQIRRFRVHGRHVFSIGRQVRELRTIIELLRLIGIPRRRDGVRIGYRLGGLRVRQRRDKILHKWLRRNHRIRIAHAPSAAATVLSLFQPASHL